jgi:hypothetical protein
MVRVARTVHVHLCWLTCCSLLSWRSCCCCAANNRCSKFLHAAKYDTVALLSTLQDVAVLCIKSAVDCHVLQQRCLLSLHLKFLEVVKVNGRLNVLTRFFSSSPISDSRMLSPWEPAEGALHR